MIYNFVEFLKIEFPGELIYVIDRLKLTGQSVIPDRCILIKDTGGTPSPEPNFNFARKTIQIITRDRVPPRARKLAYDIYDLLQGRYGLEFPVITVDTIVYNAIKTHQINAIQEPYDLGLDDQSRSEFTTNYQIIYLRG